VIHSIEIAQAKCGKTTARDLRAVCKAGSDRLFLNGDAVYDRPSYSDAFTFEMTGRSGKRNGVSTDHKITLPGYVSNGHTSERTPRQSMSGRPYLKYTETFRPLAGFWDCSYTARETLLGILQFLPAKAQVAFYVYLDAGTSELLVSADSTMAPFEKGLHQDHLYLLAYVPKSDGSLTEYRFLIDAHTSAHNTARFGNPRP
jgi:hypothetical protein